MACISGRFTADIMRRGMLGSNLFTYESSDMINLLTRYMRWRGGLCTVDIQYIVRASCDHSGCSELGQPIQADKVE